MSSTKSSSAVFYFCGARALRKPRPPHCWCFEIRQTHHTRYDSSGQGIGPTQRPLPDSTQHSQETDTHAPGGIRTRIPSKRAAADQRFTPHGHWNRHAMRIGKWKWNAEFRSEYWRGKITWDVPVGGRIILKWTVQIRGVREWTGVK